MELSLLFQKTKYIWNEDCQYFEPVFFPIDKNLDYYLEWKGYDNEEDLNKAEKYFGKNEYVFFQGLFYWIRIILVTYKYWKKRVSVSGFFFFD